MDAAAVIGGPCTGKRRRKSREPSVASVQYHGRREPPRFFFLDPSSIRGNDKSGWKPARNLGNAVVARRPKGQDDSATAAWPRAVLLPKFVSQNRREVDASILSRFRRYTLSFSTPLPSVNWCSGFIALLFFLFYHVELLQ